MKHYLDVFFYGLTAWCTFIWATCAWKYHNFNTDFYFPVTVQASSGFLELPPSHMLLTPVSHHLRRGLRTGSGLAAYTMEWDLYHVNLYCNRFHLSWCKVGWGFNGKSLKTKLIKKYLISITCKVPKSQLHNVQNLVGAGIAIAYSSGIQPGVRVPPGVREGILGGTWNTFVLIIFLNYYFLFNSLILLFLI
jgi:hypothetical protein